MTEANAVSVTVEDQTLWASLTDATLTLKSPQGQWTFSRRFSRVRLDDPSHAEGVPRIHRPPTASPSKSPIPCPTAAVYAETGSITGVPAVFVTSRLEVLADPRNQYYFWGTNFGPRIKSRRVTMVSSDGLWQGQNVGHDSLESLVVPWLGPRAAWRFLPTNCGGRGPGKQGCVSLNALPRSRILAPGDSLDARLAWPAQPRRGGAKLWAAVETRKIATVTPWTDDAPTGEPYGKPAPKWLRDAEICNFYYRPAAQWTDEVVKKSLGRFPLIVGSTPDKAALRDAIRPVVRLLHYVCYTCLLDTDMQVREGGMSTANGRNRRTANLAI